MEDKTNRLLFIDSLRGVAALWVMLYHFYNALLPEKGFQLYWAPVDAFFLNGHLGVYIFFVLSGFVINLSLRSKEMTERFFFRFFLRRLIRLDIPYWVVIVMTGISVLLMSDVGLSRRDVFDFSDYLLNMLYLNNLLDTPSIVAVGWTLQYEVQFYLFFALMLYAFSRFRVGPLLAHSILILTFVISLLYWFDWFFFYRKGLFVDYWFCFLLGVFVNDVIHNRMPVILYWFAVGLVIGHAIIFQRPEGMTAAITSVFLFAAGRLGGLESWLNWRPLLFLGSISYSLYLLHPFFGSRIIRLINYRFDISFAWSIIIFVLTIVCTLFLVSIFCKLIEFPSHRLSRKIKL